MLNKRTVFIILELTLTSFILISCSEDSTSNSGGNVTVTDIDGNVYQTIIIGDQEWMAENLKVTHYRNGDPILNVSCYSAWGTINLGAYCVYYNEPSYAEIYGNLYNWFAVNDQRGLAPKGWHVPTDEEIMELEMAVGMSYDEAHTSGYRGTNEGSILAGGYDLWANIVLSNDPEFGTSGFSILPGSYRFSDGTFVGIGYNCMLWSSTLDENAWSRTLDAFSSKVIRNTNNKHYGMSVRCVRD